MFWKFNLITTSHVETLLNKENITLRELMDEDDILQECKAQSKKLIDFLVQPEIMDEMITLVTQEPSLELDEVFRYKYSNIACELLTSDVGVINDALASDQALLNKLLTFLEHKDQDCSLNPLLASFFSKIISLLISRKTQPMFEFLQSRDEFVPQLLEHLETSAIKDLLLRLVACTENNDSRTALVKWLSEQHLIERLVALISPCHSEDHNTNAAQALCDIVRASRDHMSFLQEKADPDPLLKILESTETVSKLLDNMFESDKKESVLVSGILVILALLEFKKQGPAGQYQTTGQNNSPGGQNGGPGPDSSGLGPESPLQCFASLFFRSEGPEILTALDAERLSCGVAQVLAALSPRLGDFTHLLKNPPQKPTYSNIVQPPVEQPVGWTRLEVARLISAILNTNKHDLNHRLTELNTIPFLLDLFFIHSWNNFLHTQVEQAIGTILRNAPTCDNEDNKVHPLLDQIFLQCKIVQRLLDTWEENEQEQSQPGKHRRGYMGHLTNIANHLLRNSENPPNSELITSKLKELPDDYSKRWETFVSETLVEINKRNSTPLVSGVSSSILDADGVDFRDLHVPFQQEKQAFSDYQMDNMTNSFVDQFGFNDDEFVETDEGITDRLSRVSGNFQLDAEESMGSAELFEQACQERIASLGDGDSDEEVWEDKEITYGPGVTPVSTLSRLTAQGSSSLEESSSDSEGEEASSDSTHVLSHPLGIMGISSPESPVTAPAGNAVSLGARSLPTAPVSAGSQQPKGVLEDHKMDVDTADPWVSSFCPAEGMAMDTGCPWDPSVVVTVSSDIPSAPKKSTSSDQTWADFSCFTFQSSERAQSSVETNKSFNKTEGDSPQPAVTSSQFKLEAGTASSTLSNPPLANGQVPVMSSGPVVVVVGSSTAPPVHGDESQPKTEVFTQPHHCPETPPLTVASSKLGDDPAMTSTGTLLQSQEKGSNPTAGSTSSPAATGSPSTPACVQNGPL